MAIAAQIKDRKNIPIIFGGIHPTLLPEKVLSNDSVDMVAIGESEMSFSDLLRQMKQGKDVSAVKGIYFKKNGQIIKNDICPLHLDLDSLPFADKELFYEKMPALKNIAYSIMASRGCLFSCSYCCNDYLKRIYKDCQFYRMRSVANVVEELKLAKWKYKIKSVIFYDEVFPSEISWLKEFAIKYKNEVGLPFAIYYHFKLCTKERLLLLRQAGCKGLGFGLQSTSERIRREILNRHENNEQVREVVRLCKKIGLQVNIDHIFGLPTETEVDLKQAVDLYRELAPNLIYSYWLTYYPQVSIINIARKFGLISDNDLKIIESGELADYHNGSMVKKKQMLLKYELMFDLIPLLPKKVHRFISGNAFLLKILPKGYLSHFILIFFSMIKLNEKSSWSAFKLLFSRKYVP